VKSFAIWLVIVAIVFGVYAAVTVSLQETSQVFVVVDTSNPMAAKERQIIAELDAIDDRDDAEFALAWVRDDRNGLVHSWQSQLRWTTQPLIGPCSFADVESFTEAADADDRVLVTTTGSCDTSALTDWEIVLLD
jgi:hypothetical protein